MSKSHNPLQDTSTASSLERTLLTPADVALTLRVTPEQVRSLIRKGELAAINVGAGRRRPLYRITPQALDQFLSGRWQPGAAVRTKRASRQPQPVPDFFSNLR